MHWLSETVEQLKKGVFLMVNGNPMTIGWAQFGILWGKPTMTVYVRKSRYTYALLENADTFTVSVPASGTMREALAYCGSKSGRDTDKMKDLHAPFVNPQFGAQSGFCGCKYHIECAILFRADLDEFSLNDDRLRERYYLNGDPHRMFVGEILGVTEAFE